LARDIYIEGTFHAQTLSVNKNGLCYIWAGSIFGGTTAIDSVTGARIIIYGGAFPDTLVGNPTCISGIHVGNSGNIEVTAISVDG